MEISTQATAQDNPPGSTGRQRWACVRTEISAERGLQAGTWYRVLDRHPVPEGLSNNGFALPGYLWLEVSGQPRHVWAAHLEIREDDS